MTPIFSFVLRKYHLVKSQVSFSIFPQNYFPVECYTIFNLNSVIGTVCNNFLNASPGVSRTIESVGSYISAPGKRLLN